jgi:hypothetical protein
MSKRRDDVVHFLLRIILTLSYSSCIPRLRLASYVCLKKVKQKVRKCMYL